MRRDQSRGKGSVVEIKRSSNKAEPIDNYRIP
jgi:hypothetical protein